MIRGDLFQEITATSRRHQASARLDSMMENLQSQLDTDMTGWTQTGGSIGDREFSRVDLPTLRRNSRESFRSNPHGRVAVRTPVKFVMGGGCLVDFHEKDEVALEALMKWWKKCMKSMKWYSFAREYMTRAARDGEVLVRRFEGVGSQSPIRLRFIDPDRIPDDGIVMDSSDYETALSYRIVGEGVDEVIDAKQIHHFKGFNVDRNVKRGRPNLEVILPTLTDYKLWLKARLTLSLVRNSVAIVKQVTGTGQDLLRLRSAQAATRVRPGETNKAKMLQPGTILQGTPGVEYKMLSPNLDARDAAEDGRTFLLAAAAGAGLPDMFMTSDFCHSTDTEALTGRGWLPFGELTPKDSFATVNAETGNLEYQRSTRIHSFHYCGEMFEVESRRLNFCVTPNHELLAYRKGHRGSVRSDYLPFSSFTKIKAKDLSPRSTYFLPSSVEWIGQEEAYYILPDNLPVPMDAWLEFLGYVITDGCATEGKGYVSIGQQHGPKSEQIEACLKKLPFRYKVNYRKPKGNRRGFCDFDLSGAYLRKVVHDLIGTPEGVKSHQKHLPDFTWRLSKRQMNILLDALIFGDGSSAKRWTGSTNRIFRTNSKRLSDEVHQLAFTVGFTASLSAKKAKEAYADGYKRKDLYHVNISEGHPYYMRTSKVKKVPYNDIAWCATVPNGNLVTRRNGKTCISGNSGSNFASSVIAQNPAVREFEEIQLLLTEQFSEIVEWFLIDGQEKGQFPAFVDDNGEQRETDLEFDITFPPILRRDVAQESGAYAIMNERGVISKRTWALKMGLDPDQEQKYIDDEGGPSALAASPAPVKPPGKRVQDRNPRQNVQAGNEGEDQKIAGLTVVIKKKGKGHDKSLDVEYQVLQQEPEVEMGGDWPEKHAS